jgi:acylphosphatase
MMSTGRGGLSPSTASEASREGCLEARRLIVRGRVQGVGFRYAMALVAREAGVVGWVANRRDGCVDALVQGEAEALARVIEWAGTGPPNARVSGVESTDATADPSLVEFEIRRWG